MKKVMGIVVMLLFLVLYGCAAAETSGSCGENLTWFYDADSATMTISGTGKMTSYGIYGSAMYMPCSMKKLVVKPGVTSIGSNAFKRCDQLESVILPDGLTVIDGYAFQDCRSLKSITVPESVTFIGGSAFQGCASLPEIKIPSGVTSINISAFSDCSSLERITFSGELTSIESDAFNGCGSLKEIIIPNSVTRIGDSVFRGCSTLTGISLPSGLTRIGMYAFFNCSSLTGVTIPSGVTVIPTYAFCGCSKLTKMTIPDGISQIGQMAFEGCSNMAEITISDNVTTIAGNSFTGCVLETVHLRIISGDGAEKLRVAIDPGKIKDIFFTDSVSKIGPNAFSGIASLTEIAIPSSVTSIDFSAFSDCVNLTRITVDSSNPSYCSAGNIIFNREKTELLYYPAWKKDALYTVPSSIKIIQSLSFQNCVHLRDISIPVSVVSISANAFGSSCLNLKNVYYEGTKLDRALMGIGDGNDSLRLAKWHYSEFIPEHPDVGDQFTYNGLKYSVLSSGTVSFNGTKKAKSSSSVIIPEAVTVGDTMYKVTAIAAGAMKNDTKVTSLTIGRNVKTVGKNAFNGCVKLKTVSNGSGVVTIKDSAFSGCKALTAFPVMSRLTAIGANAFKDCVKLAEFTLETKVKSIGKNAFNGCRKLKTVTVKTTKLTAKDVKSGAFGDISKKATFKCPAKKLKSYKDLFRKAGASETCRFIK